MRQLYPPVEPYATHRLAVGELHELYIEECGNPDGIPVVFLHGGPGGGCNPEHRRYFDPRRYRIVLFDQRGCGRSTPRSELRENTTAYLVDDIEAIRQRLGIDHWLVAGGSWGSTLSLAYAEAFPARVTGLILRGVFLCRPGDIGWFYQSGAHKLYPDYWADYRAPIPEDEREDMVEAYYRRLTGRDEAERLAAARAWSLWEGRCATLLPDPAIRDHFGDPEFALTMARIECHYFRHDTFLDHDQLLRDAHRLADIPGVIVHGRFDTVCPIDQAFALHDQWPRARLEVVEGAGHAMSEPGIRDALIRAADEFADRLTGGAA